MSGPSKSPGGWITSDRMCALLFLSAVLIWGLEFFYQLIYSVPWQVTTEDLIGWTGFQASDLSSQAWRSLMTWVMQQPAPDSLIELAIAVWAVGAWARSVRPSK